MTSIQRTFTILVLIIFGSICTFFMRYLYQPTLPEIPEAIIVGTTADYPPFSFKKIIQSQKDSVDNDDEQIIGFDIDVIMEASRRINKKIFIKNVSFELLIPQAQMGTIHIIAAGLSKTPTRERQLLFTPSYNAPTAFMVISDKDKTFDNLGDLIDQRVAVSAGHAADLYMSELGHIIIDRLPSPEDALNALKNNLVDAYVIESNTQAVLNEYGIENFNTFIIPETNTQTALGVSKLYPKLAQQLNKTINEMVADGTIEQFKQKWHVE